MTRAGLGLSATRYVSEAGFGGCDGSCADGPGITIPDCPPPPQCPESSVLTTIQVSPDLHPPNATPGLPVALPLAATNSIRLSHEDHAGASPVDWPVGVGNESLEGGEEALRSGCDARDGGRFAAGQDQGVALLCVS